MKIDSRQKIKNKCNLLSVYCLLNYYISILQGEKIQTILKAANVNVESYWPGLFAKALEGINVKELITNIGSGVGAAPVGAGNICTFLSQINN